MRTFYGFNQSGGVHRLEYDAGEIVSFTYFSLHEMGWRPADWDYYSGWVDWAPLEDMPAEVQEVEKG